MELGHTEARDLFSAYVDEDLAEPEEERFLEHLDGCPECHQGLERFEDTIAQVRGLPRHRLPASFTRQVLRRAKHRNRRQRELAAFMVGPLRVPVEAAFPIILAAGVAVVLFLLH
jgi:anti-sigma factor RsiW